MNQKHLQSISEYYERHRGQGSTTRAIESLKDGDTFIVKNSHAFWHNKIRAERPDLKDLHVVLLDTFGRDYRGHKFRPLVFDNYCFFSDDKPRTKIEKLYDYIKSIIK